MIYGPVVAIPAAMISDTVGFMIYPTGDYFLPFMLTEIASTMIYALFLYRAKVSPTRVMLSRFCICLFVNVILQQFIYAWWYVYIGNPEKAMNTVMDIMTVSRILKNIAMFPIESVVMTLFLKVLSPVVRRANIATVGTTDLSFKKKHIVTLVCLTLVGVVTATGYLTYRYATTSRSADYTDKQRVEANQTMTQLVLEKTDTWDNETVVCIVDSAYRPMFEKETDYTIAVYVLDEAAFFAGMADAEAKGEKYDLETLWGYSKSSPKKDPYGSLVKVASVHVVKNDKTGEILTWEISPVE
jgi:ECF transporter S component (folate family)